MCWSDAISFPLSHLCSNCLSEYFSIFSPLCISKQVFSKQKYTTRQYIKMQFQRLCDLYFISLFRCKFEKGIQIIWQGSCFSYSSSQCQHNISQFMQHCPLKLLKAVTSRGEFHFPKWIYAKIDILKSKTFLQLFLRLWAWDKT